MTTLTSSEYMLHVSSRSVTAPLLDTITANALMEPETSRTAKTIFTLPFTPEQLNDLRAKPEDKFNSFWSSITDQQAIVQRNLYLLFHSHVVVIEADSPSWGETAVDALLARQMGKKVISVTNKVFPPVWQRYLSDLVVTPENLPGILSMVTTATQFEQATKAAETTKASRKSKKSLKQQKPLEVYSSKGF